MKKYVVIDYDFPEHPVKKLYPNLHTDYFTELPPAKFKWQWDYDSYYPRYYMHIDENTSDE